MSLYRTRAIERARRLLDGDIAVVDTETTGVDNAAEVIEVAAVGRDGSPLLSLLIRPSRPIPPESIQIHGITNEMVADAPVLSDVWPEILEVLRGKTLVAYNAQFDRRVLAQSARLYGLDPLHDAWSCAMRGYTDYIGSRRNISLINACSREGIERNEAHRALADCLATLRLIERIASGDVN